MNQDDAGWAEQLGPAYRLAQVADLLGRAEREVVADQSLLRLDTPEGVPQYPVFQFTTEQRRQAIGTVVRTLASAVATPWTTAAWLTSPKPELAERTPLQAIDDGDGDSVLREARRLRAALRR